MAAQSSIGFFDEQFRRQVRERDFALNPFESAALPFLQGDVLDYGCGLGNLSIAASERGCRVCAMDASPTAVARVRDEASRRSLPIEAVEADLRHHRLARDFDCIVCIGLLMFFDCPTALAQLEELKRHVKPGGVLVVNVLVEGTTFLEMFEDARHCLFPPGQLELALGGWTVLSRGAARFDAPGGTRKAFETVVARRPAPDLAPA